MSNVLELILLAKDKASAELKQVEGALTGVSHKAKEAENVFGSLASKFGALALGGGVVAGLALATKSAADFEHQMSQVGAIAQASSKEMGQMSDVAKQIGADTAFSAGQAAAAMEELAAGGRSVAQIVGGEAAAATSLAAAGNYDLAQSARTIATTMDVWKNSTIDTTDVVNRLAGAANASRFGVDDMSQAIASGGGVAAAMKVSFQDFSTVIAATASSFSSGSDAGTSFKTFLIALGGNSKEAKAAIADLGLEFYNTEGQLKPLAQIVQELHDKMSGLSDIQQTVALKTIFGNDAYRTAAGLMKMTGDEFTTMSKKMGDTNAADVAKQRLDNMKGSLEALKGSLETVAINIGERVIPSLTNGAEYAAKFVNAFGEMPSSTQNVILIGGAIAALAPLLVNSFQKGAQLIKSFGEEGLTAKGKIAGLALGLTALTVGVDLILSKTSGHGLFDRLFGDPARADAATEAIKRFNEATYGIDDPTKKAAAAMKELNTIADATRNGLVEARGGVLGLADSWIAQAEGAVGAKDSYTKMIESTKDYEERVKNLARVLVSANTPLSDMKAIYDGLNPVLKDAFKSVFDVEAATLKAADANEILHMKALQVEASQRAAAKAAAEFVGPIQQGAGAAGSAATAVDRFVTSLGEVKDVAKAADEAIDNLIAGFASANPEVHALQATNAFLQESIDDIKASTTDLTEEQKKQIAGYEAIIEANDKTIAGYTSNERALKGAKLALQEYLGRGEAGAKALGGLMMAFRDANVPLEEQVDTLARVNGAFTLLKDGSISKAISGFADLKVSLKDQPEAWGAAAAAIGPKFIEAINKGIADPAQRADLLNEVNKIVNDAAAAGKTAAEAGAPAIGAALIDGVTSGLRSAAASGGMVGAFARTIQDAIDAGKRQAGISSPSKVTEEQIGKPLVEGVAVGIDAATGQVIWRAGKLVDDAVTQATARLAAAFGPDMATGKPHPAGGSPADILNGMRTAAGGNPHETSEQALERLRRSFGGTGGSIDKPTVGLHAFMRDERGFMGKEVVWDGSGWVDASEWQAGRVWAPNTKAGFVNVPTNDWQAGNIPLSAFGMTDRSVRVQSQLVVNGQVLASAVSNEESRLVN